MEVIRLNDLYPDKVRVVVDWDAWEVGMSAFLPCIHTKRLRSQLTEIGQRLGYKLEMRPGIENHYFGVRIWRTA